MGEHGAARCQQPSERDLHAQYGALVQRIARALQRRLPLNVTAAELEQSGWVGLLEAIARRPAEMSDEQFDLLASCRIRGAMLDQLRSDDPLPRRVRRFTRDQARARSVLSSTTGQPASDVEVAAAMGLALASFRRMQAATLAGTVLSVDANDGITFFLGNDDHAESLLAERNEIEAIRSALDTLPPRLREIIRSVDLQSETLRTVGDRLGVSESRVSQLRGEALRKLATVLRDSVEQAPVRAAA